MWPGPCLISFIYSSNMAYLACTRHHPCDGHITCPLNTSLSHLRAFARALSTLPPPAGLSLPFQSLLQCSFLQEAYPDQIMQTRPFPTDTEFCVFLSGGWGGADPAPHPHLHWLCALPGNPTVGDPHCGARPELQPCATRHQPTLLRDCHRQHHLLRGRDAWWGPRRAQWAGG